MAKTPLLGRKHDSSRFSQTDRLAKIDGVWNLRPTPRAAISFSRRPTRLVSLPKTTRPDVGSTLPEMTSSSVVLPAPLGPITTRSSR